MLKFTGGCHWKPPTYKVSLRGNCNGAAPEVAAAVVAVVVVPVAGVAVLSPHEESSNVVSNMTASHNGRYLRISFLPSLSSLIQRIFFGIRKPLRQWLYNC